MRARFARKEVREASDATARRLKKKLRCVQEEKKREVRKHEEEMQRLEMEKKSLDQQLNDLRTVVEYSSSEEEEEEEEEEDSTLRRSERLKMKHSRKKLLG